MSGYVLSVFAICLIAEALRLLSYGRSAVERFAVGVITLSVILAPISGIISDFDVEGWLDSLKQEQGEINSEYEATVEAAFSDGIKRAVAEEFSLNKDNIRVRVVGFNAAEMSAERIYVSLSGSAAIADYRAVKKYLDRLDIGECDVSIEIK